MTEHSQETWEAAGRWIYCEFSHFRDKAYYTLVVVEEDAFLSVVFREGDDVHFRFSQTLVC